MRCLTYVSFTFRYLWFVDELEAQWQLADPEFNAMNDEMVQFLMDLEKQGQLPEGVTVPQRDHLSP